MEGPGVGIARVLSVNLARRQLLLIDDVLVAQEAQTGPVVQAPNVCGTLPHMQNPRSKYEKSMQGASTFFQVPKVR